MVQRSPRNAKAVQCSGWTTQLKAIQAAEAWASLPGPVEAKPRPSLQAMQLSCNVQRLDLHPASCRLQLVGWVSLEYIALSASKSINCGNCFIEYCGERLILGLNAVSQIQLTCFTSAPA